MLQMCHTHIIEKRGCHLPLENYINKANILLQLFAAQKYITGFIIAIRNGKYSYIFLTNFIFILSSFFCVILIILLHVNK